MARSHGTAGPRDVLYSFGHSTRTTEALLGTLRAHGVSCVADIRTYPASRRHPHLARAPLSAALERAGLRYEWLGDTLGGFRRVSDAVAHHPSIRNASFRNYAAHMETPEFHRGIDRLLELAREGPTAFMCSELLWWRCHRSMVSDFLVGVRGAVVRHILDEPPPREHSLRAEARVDGDRVLYDRPSPARKADRKPEVSVAAPKRPRL